MFKVSFPNETRICNNMDDVLVYIKSKLDFLGEHQIYYEINEHKIIVDGVKFGNITHIENSGTLSIINDYNKHPQDLIHHNDFVIDGIKKSLIKNRYGTTNLIVPDLKKYYTLDNVPVYVITDDMINSHTVDLSVVEHVALVFRCTRYGITILKDVDNIFDGTEFCSSYYNNILKSCGV